MGHVILFNKARQSKSSRNDLKLKRYFLLDNSLKFFGQGWMYSKRILNKISFKFTRNDGVHQSVKILTKLKMLFSAQLPNIPRLYVEKQILDKKHILITLLKFNGKNKKIIGSCCFRIFESNQFIELIFFAVSTKTQGFGYGSYLMSFLKDFAKSIKINYIITCADNNAIAFFLKQGFTKILTNPVSIWFRHIREYEEVELMECLIYSKNSYLFSYLAFLFQKTLHIERIKILFQSTKNISRKEKNIPKKFSLSSRISEKQKKKNFYSSLFSILDQLRSDDYFVIFFEPVDTRKTGVEDYFEHLVNSIDLRSIEEKIRNGNFILSKVFFIQLIKRMINNNILFTGGLDSMREICKRIKKCFHQAFGN